MVNSKRKGSQGEREFAKLCREHGFSEARRGQQFSGIEGKDVVGLPKIHTEVKRVQRLNISNAMKQAIGDAKNDEIPIVAHRKDREEWLITMLATDWFEFYKAWLEKTL